MALPLQLLRVCSKSLSVGFFPTSGISRWEGEAPAEPIWVLTGRFALPLGLIFEHTRVNLGVTRSAWVTTRTTIFLGTEGPFSPNDEWTVFTR